MALHKILFGTYTKQDSKGVYEAELDTTTQELSNPELVATLTNPTYLALSAANVVYAVENRHGHSGVVAMDNNERPMVELDAQLTEGTAPAYLGVDENRQLVFAGYYHRGMIEVYKIIEDGKLRLTDRWYNHGSGPRPEQGSAHIHYADLAPDQRMVAVDLGSDQVITFDVSEEGKLTEVARYQAEAGFGPRHICFSPDGQYAYLLGELSSLLSVLKYNTEDGSFEHVMTASTIPDDWTGHNGAAAIRISHDGKFVYTSNRGHDSVSVFQIHNLGAEIELVQLVSTEGSFPRDMALDPSQNFLVVANQKTDNVSLYDRNHENGELTLVQKDFYIPEGVSVLFEN
ncbi:lactonase family protein [Lactobacillaceae bacterium L1_55_11]|nr:lactonase family protein [Lactobacillaceae bacterium L1_55_11]